MENLKKILVIDDNTVNLKMAEKVLQEFSKPVLVPSGKLALKYLENNLPDLILLDINMPDINGFTLMKHLQSSSRTSNIPVIFLTASVDAKTEVACLKLGATDFVRKPFIPEVLINRVKHALEIQDYQKNLAEKVRAKTRQIESMQREIIMTIANLIENRDGTTGQHVKRTSRFVACLVTAARDKKLYPELESELYVYNAIKSAPLHDIGKISIPDYILKKPDRLTDEEYNLMKTHTSIGGQIILENFRSTESTEYILIASNVAHYHHEHWDGSGYPYGIKGTDIPLEARIMAIADVFDALISSRCYKKAFTLEEAYSIMEKEKGKQFDPLLLELFLENKEQIERLI